MHSLGIAHRDLKPENILLKNDTIKITDFGLATLYKNADGVERLLESKCGTAPYVSPEVLAKPNYKAMPVDVWAAGIVLVALLAGGKSLYLFFYMYILFCMLLASLLLCIWRHVYCTCIYIRGIRWHSRITVGSCRSNSLERVQEMEGVCD